MIEELTEIPEGVEDVIYLDNAATVYPKPKAVLDAMIDLYRRFGVNPGRSGYDLCVVGGNFVDETRRRLTEFFGGDDPSRLCFAYNASDALNILIFGLVNEGDHVISTVLEHNSVLRPLNHLKRDKGVEVDLLEPGPDWRISPERVAAAIKKNTKLVAINHGSNVIGIIQPVAEIGRICREKGVTFLIDTAQTAGMVPINMKEMNIDALAFTGHKSLLGPTGIGGLCVREDLEVRHTRAGGTGVKSAYPYHLEEYPYRLEVGTGNFLGIAGLLEAQKYLARKGVENIYHHEMELFTRLEDGLSRIKGLTLHGPKGSEHRLPVLSFTLEAQDPADTGTMLDVDHSIATRTGLQCAPLVHDHLGTSPRGTVRMSIGPGNKAEDIEAAIRAVESIAAGVRT
ncbi:aminotransferase class V-fold PLP-dependent enzyme [Elusimicrobiota bacterium]